MIFFADEAGAWQVGIDEPKMLGAYFTSLAASATPEEYGAKVSTLITRRGRSEAEGILRAARTCGSPEQRQALKKV